MKRAIFLRAISWWTAILVLAIVNGALREEFLIPLLGVFTAQIVSGLILSALIQLVALIAMPGFGPVSAKGYWLIGLAWLVMTLIFEFSFGLFVQHKDMAELLQAYTFTKGNIWPLVLASTLVSARVAAYLRRLA